jgi:serine protease Do
MKLLKVLTVLVVLAGAGLWVTAYGQERRDGDRPEVRAHALTMLDGRGGRIGIAARDLDQPEADGRKLTGGVVIEEVQPDSPAEKAGLKPADVIVEYDGEHVRSARQFSRLVQETAPGRTVKATVVRDGRRSDVQITPDESRGARMLLDGDRLSNQLRDRLGAAGEYLQQFPPLDFNFDFDMPGMPGSMSSRGRLGVTVDELSDQLAAYFGAKDGVLVAAVTEGSAADRAGVKAGDVITSVNGDPIRSREDLTQALRDVKDDGEVSIGIVRDRKESSVKATLEPPRRPRRSIRPA